MAAQSEQLRFTDAQLQELFLQVITNVNELCAYMQRPSTTFRPAISLDGDKWIALYGDNLQEGVVGIGDTPEAAMRAFDAAWFREQSLKR